MTDLIKLLEYIGQNADWRISDRAQREQVLSDIELEPELRGAILEGNSEAIADALDARKRVICFIAPAEEDDEDGGEEPAEPGDDETDIRFASGIARKAG